MTSEDKINSNKSKVANKIVRYLSNRGLPTKRKSTENNEFILTKKDQSSSNQAKETELIWVACDKIVTDTHIKNLEQISTNVSADSIRVVTTTEGNINVSSSSKFSHSKASYYLSEFQEQEDEDPDINSINSNYTNTQDTTVSASPPWDSITSEEINVDSEYLWDGTTVNSSNRVQPQNNFWDGKTF